MEGRLKPPNECLTIILVGNLLKRLAHFLDILYKDIHQVHLSQNLTAPISGVNLVRSLGVVNPVAEIFDSSQKMSDLPEKFSRQKF